MKKKFFWLFFASVVLAICFYFQKTKFLPIYSQKPIQTCSYQVVNTYPHDPTAFTQGLIYHEGQLYESTGLKGRSSIRRVELKTGKVLQIHRLEDRYFGEGMTLWQDRLIQLTWVSNIGFVYNYQTLEPIQTFTYPTEGWGLTHNGRELILSDGSDTLYFLNPHNFQQIRQIQVKDNQEPIDNLNELEHVKDEILANVWQTNRIARISPDTGKVLGWIDLTGIINPLPVPQSDAVLNGIAYDAEGDRLFITGKLWDKLFEIDTKCE